MLGSVIAPVFKAPFLVPVFGLLRKPVSFCQLDSGKTFPADGLNVSNRSSWTTWNCGEACPVFKLSTSDTFLECLGEAPK